MAKGIPISLLLLVDTMMAARAPVELQDGVSLLQINNSIDTDYDTDDKLFDEFKVRLAEIQNLQRVPRVLNAAFFSTWMYFLSEWPAGGWRGWTLQAKYAGRGDDVALFKNGLDQCVLAFKGTENLKQWLSNANFRTTEGQKEGAITAYKCGLGAGHNWRDQEVHSGFWEDMKEFLMKSWGVEPPKPKRKSSFEKLLDGMGDAVFGEPPPAEATDSNNIPMSEIKKCTQLDVTGHSKGGAMASIYAACANGFFFKRSWKNVDRLYTFGAPAIAVHAPRPELVGGNEVFQGERVFNMDKKGNHDLVAGITTFGGSRRRRNRYPNYMHPKMKAVALTGDKTALTLPADRYSTVSTPKFDKTFYTSLHATDLYLKRLIELARG